MNSEPICPRQSVAHLKPGVWNKVNSLLVAKAIGEFAHELLIEPKLMSLDGAVGYYSLGTDRADVEYHFRARVLALEHWCVEPGSVAKRVGGRDAPIDAREFVVDLRQRLGIPDHVLPGYLDEIASTLCGSAFKHERSGLTAAELTRAGFQEIEASMMEGHPIFVANNGRTGFDAQDYRAYAPEVGAPIQLVWLAAKQQSTESATLGAAPYSRIVAEQLSAGDLARFDAVLKSRGLDPGKYALLPVHPWQWQNRIAQLFAADLANGDLVCLGVGEDQYQAQQSIRTLYNTSHPDKHYVKTALSIVNMGFTRGLTASMTKQWAAVNDWVSCLLKDDAVLEQLGFGLLREVAFVGYRHRYYEKVIEKRVAPHREMLAAVFRESPHTRVKPGQSLMTMAALMHVDRDGNAVLSELVRASTVGTDAWLQSYLRCYLTPLLHCFYAYKLVFTPHCENVILVMAGHVPVGVVLKDLAEDIGVLNPESPLPESVRHLALRVPEEVMTLSIFTDVFDCVFRFLAAILQQRDGYPEERFWCNVARCILDYQSEHPEYVDKFQRYDLFASTFIRNCLNRLQLKDNRLMVDLNAEDPVDSLQFVGVLKNPIALWSETSAVSGPREESHATV